MLVNMLHFIVVLHAKISLSYQAYLKDNVPFLITQRTLNVPFLITQRALKVPFLKKLPCPFLFLG